MADPLLPIAGLMPAEQLAADFRRLGVASGEVRINHLRSAIHRGSIQIARSWHGLRELAEFAPMESDLATLLASAYRTLDPRNRPNYQERIFLACLSERPHPTERRTRDRLMETRPSLWSAISRLANKQDDSQQAGVGLSPGGAASWRLVGIDPEPEADELSLVNAASLYGMLADRPDQARDSKSGKQTVARNGAEKETTGGSPQSRLPNPDAMIGKAAPKTASQSDSQQIRPSSSSTLEERREVVQSLRQLSKGKAARKPSPATKATPRGNTPDTANPSLSAEKPSAPVSSAPLPLNTKQNRKPPSAGPRAPSGPVKAKGVPRPSKAESPKPQAPGRHTPSKGKVPSTPPTRTLAKAPTRPKKRSRPIAAVQGSLAPPATDSQGEKVTWTQLLWQWLQWPLKRSRASRDSNVSKWIDGLPNPHRDSSKSV